MAAQAHRELAVAEALVGDKTKIAGHISRAVELQSGNSGNHAWAAIAYAIAGNVDAARSATKSFDEASNGGNFTQTLNGVVLVAAGEYKSAEKVLIESGMDDDWANVFLVRCERALETRPMQLLSNGTFERTIGLVPITWGTHSLDLH